MRYVICLLSLLFSFSSACSRRAVSPPASTAQATRKIAGGSNLVSEDQNHNLTFALVRYTGDPTSPGNVQSYGTGSVLNFCAITVAHAVETDGTYGLFKDPTVLQWSTTLDGKNVAATTSAPGARLLLAQKAVRLMGNTTPYTNSTDAKNAGYNDGFAIVPIDPDSVTDDRVIGLNTITLNYTNAETVTDSGGGTPTTATLEGYGWKDVEPTDGGVARYGQLDWKGIVTDPSFPTIGGTIYYTGKFLKLSSGTGVGVRPGDSGGPAVVGTDKFVGVIATYANGYSWVYPVDADTKSWIDSKLNAGLCDVPGCTAGVSDSVVYRGGNVGGPYVYCIDYEHCDASSVWAYKSLFQLCHESEILGKTVTMKWKYSVDDTDWQSSTITCGCDPAKNKATPTPTATSTTSPTATDSPVATVSPIATESPTATAVPTATVSPLSSY